MVRRTLVSHIKPKTDISVCVYYVYVAYIVVCVQKIELITHVKIKKNKEEYIQQDKYQNANIHL